MVAEADGALATVCGHLRDRLAAVAPGMRVVACSGGLDSSVLLAALTRLHAEAGCAPPRVVHLDHGLQAGSARWADAVRRICEASGAPCSVIHLDVTRTDAGLEADARRARYAAFATLLQPGEHLLLAHHRDDQVETVLLRLLRGAGPAGLAAMPARRALGRGWLLRPLLELDRSVLEAAAIEAGLEIHEDPSNALLDFDRNYLRHSVLPLIERRWPGHRRTISRAAELCREQETALQGLLGPAPRCLPVSMLTASPALAAVRLRQWLATQGVRVPSRDRLEEILRQAEARADASVRVVVGDHEVRRFAGALHLVPRERPAPPEEAVPWRPPTELQLPNGRLGAVEVTGRGLRQDVGTLRVDHRRGGERLRPAGRAGHGRLKQLLQEAGVPPWERDRLPLLWREGELVAIADLYVAEGWQAGPGEPGWQIVWTPTG